MQKKHSKGGYKKACGAVARRIAVALYFVHKRNTPFSYEKYNFYKQDVPEILIEDMGLSNRLTKILQANALTDSKKITETYITGQLYDIKGFGSKAALEIQTWIDKYKNTGRKEEKNGN